MGKLEKVREDRVRRIAHRWGMRLIKSRRRDPQAVGFGTYWIAKDVPPELRDSIRGSEVVYAPAASDDDSKPCQMAPVGATLDEVEEYFEVGMGVGVGNKRRTGIEPLIGVLKTEGGRFSS